MFMHPHERRLFTMHTSGWRPFWTALGPGCWCCRPRRGHAAAHPSGRPRPYPDRQPQSGVAVALPRKNHQATLLLCLAGDQPGFVPRATERQPELSASVTPLPGELDLPAGCSRQHPGPVLPHRRASPVPGGSDHSAGPTGGHPIWPWLRSGCRRWLHPLARCGSVFPAQSLPRHCTKRG